MMNDKILYKKYWNILGKVNDCDENKNLFKFFSSLYCETFVICIPKTITEKL